MNLRDIITEAAQSAHVPMSELTVLSANREAAA